MKIRYWLCFLLSVIFLTAFFSERSRSADIMDIGSSARPISMGRAFSAVEGSVDCILFNPAGLAGIDSLRLSSMYSNISNDFSYANLALALPVKYGAIGFAMLSERSGMLYRTALDSDGRIIEDGAYSPFNFTNQVYVFSYAGQFGKKFSAGARLKLYEKEGYMVEGGRGTGTAVDLGLLYNLDARTNIGLYQENLLSSGISWPTGTRDPLPARTKIGIMFRPRQEWTFVADAVMSGNDPLSFKAGSEWRANELLFLRAGLEQADIGGEKYLNYSLGAGSNFKSFYINYAYAADTLLKENSSHFVSIGLDISSFYIISAESSSSTSEATKKIAGKNGSGTKTAQAKRTGSDKDLTAQILDKEALSVRKQINNLDSQIKKAKAKKDKTKVQTLKNEKNAVLKRWEEMKKSQSNPLGSKIKRTN